MEYLSPKEIAEKWRISERRVHFLCSEGRIDGAVRMCRTWLIPKDALKPTDPRKNPVNKAQKKSQYIPYILFMDSLSFYPGEADKMIANLDRDERRQAECEFAYLRGEFGFERELYANTPLNSKLRLCAMNIAAYAAVEIGELELFITIYDEMMKMKCSDKNDEIAVVLIDISLHFLLAALKIESAPINMQTLLILPMGARKCAYLANSYCFAFNERKYDRVAENLEMLLNSHENGRYTPRDIYLYLMCGASFGAIGQVEKVRYFMEEAIDKGFSDGFIMPFIEKLVIGGKVLAECLKARDKNLYKRIETLARQSYNNVAAFHNHFEKSNICTALNVSEIHLAFLIKQGFTNYKIAEMWGVSVATVKRQLEVIFDKLNISKRSELNDYLL